MTNTKLQNVELSENLKNEQNKLALLTEKHSKQQRELTTTQLESSDLGDQLEQMKSLTGSLERTREELLKRLEDKSGENHSIREELKLGGAQAVELSAVIGRFEAERREQMLAMQEIDSARDGLQNQLDEKVIKME